MPARNGEPNSPCKDQSDKSIRNWLRSNIKVGAIVAVRRIQGGKLQYERAVVLSVRPKNFNVGVELGDGSFAGAGETFDNAGRNRRDPKARIVIPTEAVLQACILCDFGRGFMPGDADTYIYSVH
jgi:hypothetical protein